MVDYRIYFLDDAGGMRTKDFDAQSDSEAITVARAMRNKASCELWTLDRFVTRISPYRYPSGPYVQ